MRLRGSGWRKVSVSLAIASSTFGIGHGGEPSTAHSSGPAKKYDCAFNPITDAYTGAFATASAIGWLGNYQGVVTCLGGTFFVQDGIEKNFGFGIYDGSRTTWVNADGYLPAQVTTFRRYGAVVSITEFADKLELKNRSFVAVYSRVEIRNPTGDPITASPDASLGMVILHNGNGIIAPYATTHYDYVVAVDRFGHEYPWPSDTSLAMAGDFDQHFNHMEQFWDRQLASIAQIKVPEPTLVNAYKSGFIYTQIARNGDNLNTGINGYDSQFSHDVIGILSNFFTQGYFNGAHDLLLDARSVVGSQGQYDDGIWTYSWPWAIYLMKTGDVSFVRDNFSTAGPKGAKYEPSIEDTAHDIAAARTGPGGIIEKTNDIDTDGYWTVDDYEALMGLVAYRYIAEELGYNAQVKWATNQYNSLLAATDKTLDATISRYKIKYLPCSMVEPNSADRCSNPEDANWAATFQFGKWAWDAQMFDVPVAGVGVRLIDATYSYGFKRLKGRLPTNTFGGYPDDYYSTAYNAGYGSWGLAGNDFRDQGILSYEFMIDNDQSGPYSWWESSSTPSKDTPWAGSHPTAGQGSSPHAWGMSEANKVLLDSIVAQVSNGDLIVGRGIPSSWLHKGDSIAVTNFPSLDGGRLSISISSSGNSVTLKIGGKPSSSSVLLELPGTTGTQEGTFDSQSGIVTLPPGTQKDTVGISH